MSRDSFVEVQRAFYEAPPEYIGRQVWVRWDSRCVRIFNDRLEQVQIHLRLEPGKFSRILGVAGMSAPVLSSCRWWIGRAALLGEACGQWAQSSVDQRGPEALRSIMDFAIWLKSTRRPPSTPLVIRRSRPAPGDSKTSNASSVNQASRATLPSLKITL